MSNVACVGFVKKGVLINREDTLKLLDTPKKTACAA